MNLIEIQMQSEDKTNGDKLGAPPGAAAPPTHIFLIIIIKKKGWEMYSQIRKPAYAKMLGEMFGCSSWSSSARARTFPSSPGDGTGMAEERWCCSRCSEHAGRCGVRGWLCPKGSGVELSGEGALSTQSLPLLLPPCLS